MRSNKNPKQCFYITEKLNSGSVFPGLFEDILKRFQISIIDDTVLYFTVLLTVRAVVQ